VLARELGWSKVRREAEQGRFADEAEAEGILAEVERPSSVGDETSPPLPTAMP
jgi:hypothetical protein